MKIMMRPMWRMLLALTSATHTPPMQVSRLTRRYQRLRLTPRPTHTRIQRGQTLVIFALVLTALIGFLGLAIDTVRVFDEYARMQRAADAGALAAVIYMPNFYTTSLSGGSADNAVCRAEKEIYKNGFGSGCSDPSKIGSSYCPTPPTSVEIAVCAVSGKQYDLRVTITETMNVLFLSALNVGPLTISASGQASFIPPLSLGSDPSNPGGTAALATTPFCSGVSCNGRPWALNINGPAELQEQGDPFVTCSEGNANTQTPDAGASSYSAYPYTTDTGWKTNHPLYTQSVGTPPSNCTAALSTPVASNSAYSTANPDYTNQPFAGAVYSVASGQTPSTHPGYSYYVHATTDQSALWVWNAPFNAGATPSSCNGRTVPSDSFFPCPFGRYSTFPNSDFATKGLQDPKLYFAVTYSIYRLDDGPADPFTTTYLGSFTALPYYTGGGCTQTLPSAKYSITTSACATSACALKWCPIGNQTGDTIAPTAISLQAGKDYRVTVVSSSYYDQGFDLGWGQHSYGLEVCPPGSTAASQPCNGTTPAGSISAWSTMDTLFLFPGKGTGSAQHTGIPLGFFDKSMAARTIDVGMYDAGDMFGTNGGLSATAGFAVVPTVGGASDPCLETTAQIQAAGFDPTVNGATFSFPSWERVTTMDKIGSSPAFPTIETSLNGDRAYNGLWVYEKITLPANYTATPWSVCAWGSGIDSEIVGFSAVAEGQSPVHLVG